MTAAVHPATEGGAWHVAEQAYLRAYGFSGVDSEQAPWGLHVSTEDAMIAVVRALFPQAGFGIGAAGYEALRQTPRLEYACDIMDELEQSGYEAGEIAIIMVDIIEEALSLSGRI